MSEPTQPSKAARIVSAFFKPKTPAEPEETTPPDEPEQREKPYKSFAKNVTSAIVNRIRK